MKIFSIINNCNRQAACSEGFIDGKPDWWVLPDSVMLRSGKPVFLPGDDGEYKILPSLCIKISRLGKFISPKFAHRYISEIAPAVEFVKQSSIDDINKGYAPRQSDLVFDSCVVVGDFIPVDNVDSNEISLDMSISNGDSFKWDTSSQLMSNDDIISMVSCYNTIKMGDLVLTALPSDGPVARRNTVAYLRLGDKELLKFKLK